MENKTVILLLSGGIDSTTLLAKLTNEGKKIIALSYSYGQKHSIELEYAQKNAQKYGVLQHHVINLDTLPFQSSALVNKDLIITSYGDYLPMTQVNAYVPFRNLIFISIALSLAESLNINEIYLASNQDDKNNFWDCQDIFINKLNDISNMNTTIQINNPFSNMTKQNIVSLALELKVDLKETITCYQPQELKECGVCLSCITKQKALEYEKINKLI